MDSLKEFLHYHQESGKLLWKSNKKPINQWREAGTLWVNGYVRIRCRGKYYYAHRVVWYLAHGENVEIDHINGIRTDNRIENLRSCNRQQNLRNSSKHFPNGSATSKCKGVYWSKQKSKWHARINVDGKTKHLGFFSDEKDAAVSYDAALLGVDKVFAKTNFEVAQ